ncbi:hypothetical protein BCR44DRAFT_1497904 [Catenaria anguillulae PL171]|uniref:Uncharacterized protein n=1 Tax=Catenaria anguillulae PL171 TaxID=765915 RepID=A0A1Y2HW98_9FUNG|nr:hypothetical protein BCR44DRAFT_1497904 [Catenaria anguillulae PL171]
MSAYGTVCTGPRIIRITQRNLPFCSFDMEPRCLLAELPVKLLTGIVSWLDIRSAGRLPFTGKYFVSSRLLQNHQDSPFFSAIQHGDTEQPTDNLFDSIQARLSVAGVMPQTAPEFQNLLTKCSWHRDFVLWILGIAPESLRVLLAKFPIDISPGQTQHGPKDGTDDEMLVWSYESHTDDCLRCQEIFSTAAEGAKRAGSSSGSVSAKDAYFKVIAEEPAGHCKSSGRKYKRLLGTVQSIGRWPLDRDLMTGAEVYELRVVASQLQSTALPFPISFGAVMNALLELHDFERALCLLNHHQSKLQGGGDGHGWDWVVTERAIEP